jgi:hypothetical protein
VTAHAVSGSSQIRAALNRLRTTGRWKMVDRRVATDIEPEHCGGTDEQQGGGDPDQPEAD